MPLLYATQALCQAARDQDNTMMKKTLKAGEWYDCIPSDVIAN